MSIKFFNYKIIAFISFISVALISLVLLQLPLTSTFGYEFSLVFALIFFFAAGLLNIHRHKKKLTLKSFLRFSLLILLTPVFIVLLVSLFKDICSFWLGLWFYLTLAVVSFWISFFISEIIFQAFLKFHKIIFLIVILIIALIPVYEVYFYPQIYFYSPIVGYFPGTIYDEELAVNESLILYRILNLIYFGSLYLLFNRNIIQKKILAAILFVSIGILFQFLSPELGYSTTHAKLNNVLPAEIETKNFVVRYDNSVIDSSTILTIILNHEFYFENLKNQIRFSPKEKIKSYIFNDRKQKKKYFGSEQADVAKPWIYEIYVSKDSWETTLKHELVHIFSAEIGKGIFNLADSFNPALIEGFAEAVDNNYDNINLHTLTASAFYYGYKIPIKDLFSGFNFFKSYSGLSYLYAGSFSKFLIEKFGLKAYSVFYAYGDCQHAFGKNLDQLVEEYYNFLKSIPVSLSKEQIDFYFARSSMFQKLCPRQIAYDLKKAELSAAENKLAEAEEIYYSILEKTPNYNALTGLISIYSEQKKYYKAKSLLAKYIIHFQNTGNFFNLKLMEGDLSALTDDEENSLKCYNVLIEKIPHIHLKLLSELRIELFRNRVLKEYLEGNDSTKYRLLVGLNQRKVTASTILPLVSLAERLKIPSSKFLDTFRTPFMPENSQDSYLLYILSKYLLNNSDAVNARKIASLAMRKSFGSIYYISIKEHFDKCNWFVKNQNLLNKKSVKKNESQ
ncbi:MAG: hypothetical protein HZC46_02595 [Ignavibacterium album]|uniref:tetratricopeptide repeat protein n=1 Tax=Ignavibacterium album TaxID=591197 RepID=UPI0026EB8554|nr:tetratricopeptide repeat protein [Ignavibacterium album]MBI5661015.1 hypothetical protein [Ignavibacterium album]